MGVTGRKSVGQLGTLLWTATWVLFSVVPQAQTAAQAPGMLPTLQHCSNINTTMDLLTSGVPCGRTSEGFQQ